MKIFGRLLFALAVNSAHASPCPDQLSIPIQLQGTLSEIYDHLDWSNKLGRSFTAEFMAKDEVERVTQTVLSWDQFTRTYPPIADLGEKLLHIHRVAVDQAERSFKLLATTSGLKMIGLGKHARELRRKMPGELGQIALVVGDQVLASSILASVVKDQGRVEDANDPFITLRVSAEHLLNDLLQALAKCILQTGEYDNVSVDVFYFHTHPGYPSPLSPADRDVLESAKQHFTRNYPYVNFRFVMAAAAQQKIQGDLVFVQEIIALASQPLSELLAKLRQK